MNDSTHTIGLLGAVAIGVGGMVGGGIFAVLGEAVSLAHGATAVAFGVAGLVALLTAYAYAHLSMTYPNRGGTVVFIDTAFGNNLLSGSLNLMLWLSYLVTIALYAVAFASYAETFFNGQTGLWLRHVLISAAIILPTVINLASTSLVSRTETLIVVVKLLLLVVIIALSIGHIDMARVSPTHWGSMTSIVAAGMIVFVAYEGFELIANAAEDIADPGRNLPLAFFISVILVIVLYVLIALVTVSTVPEEQIMQARDYALAMAAKPALGQTGFVLVAVAALMATFSAINATIYGNARLGFILARHGELPEVFDHQFWNEPALGVISTALISLLIANTTDLTAIAIIGSASFLLFFAVINVSAWTLRSSIGGRPAIYLAGAAACVGALGTLLLHTWQSNPGALGVLGGFMFVSVLFELTYGRLLRGHFFGRSY